MRCLLISLTLTCGFVSSFAQNQLYDGFLGSKWYINAAEIGDFGSNDTSVIITSLTRGNYVYFGEKLEFGRDSTGSYKQESTFYFYRVVFDNVTHTGWVDLYNSKKDARKGKACANYDLLLDPYQLKLVGSDSDEIDELIDDVYFKKTLLLSKERDTRGLTTRILGNWVCDSSINLLFEPPTDTIVFTKTSLANGNGNNCLYTFLRIEGETHFTSKCLSYKVIIPETNISGRNRRVQGYNADPFYVNHGSYGCSVDLEHQQLILGDYPERTFQIIEITNTQMKLLLLKN